MEKFWAAGLLLLAAACGVAQNATRIDGRHHPELIPDKAAYRAVLLMQSHFATTEEIARSEQFHSRLGLTAADHTAYDQILVDFRQQYDNLVRTHDKFIDSSASSSIEDMRQEIASFRQSLSALVQSVRNQLAAQMSKEGLARLDAFIQSEKAHMVVGTRSAQ